MTEPENTAPVSAPPEPPRFVGGAPRTETVKLDWPVEYDGKVYDAITVRRLTVGEIAAFVESLQASGAPAAQLPMFDAPAAVMQALDADDDERVSEVAQRFLPRRFREGSGGSTPPTGA